MIRLFVSSTFRDMHAERDQLSRIVFPELRSRCLKRGADFLGLDLRWGVTEEEAEQEGALALCLKEIERCRPFFVCLLGDRFGWVPPPEEVPSPLLEAVRDADALPHAIAELYHLDETVLPAIYRLRRDRKLPNDAAEELARFWESKGLPLAGDSITAREILRGIFEDRYPATHAFLYLRKPGLERHPAFPGSFVPVFVEQSPDRRRKLASLKERIRASVGQVSVRDYEAGYAGLRIDSTLLPPGLSAGEREALRDGVIAPDRWLLLSEPVRSAIEAHGTVALDGMEALGQDIIDDLWPAIEAELERPVEALDSHQRERAYHERFVIDRTRLFIGRASETRQVAAYIANAEDRRPLVVTGPPGAGKSAFLAGCVRHCRELHPTALVVPHFIGAAPDSSALPATLRSLCETLRRELAIAEDVEADPLKLRFQLGSFLEKAGAQRPVIVFLDALNQLDPAGRSHELDWIPYLLPPGTKLVVSTLAGDCLEQLRRRVPDDFVIDIPALPVDDRRQLVEQFLDVRRKKLTAEQLARILDTTPRPDAGLPLYLLVALEELCLFGDHQTLSQRIDRLPERLPELFDQVLARLEQDHARSMTESVCSWIGVSRSGLLESEVLDLLSGTGTFPRIRWTRLYRGLEPYLKPAEEDAGTEGRGAGLLDFYHDQLRLAAYRRYLGMAGPDSGATEVYRMAHRQLAGYFRSIAQDEAQPGEWRTDRVRGLSELPHHQTLGEIWEEMEQTLCDLNFIAAKCAAGMTYDLVADYDAVLAALPEGREERERQRELDERVARYTREIVEYARQWNKARDCYQADPVQFPLPQPADIPLPEPPPSVRLWTDEEIQANTDRIATSPARLDRIHSFGQFVKAESGELASFSSRRGFCLQQAYNWASSSAVGRAAEERIATGKNPLLLLRRRRRGNPHSARLMTLKGHTGVVESVALTGDGRRAVSGASDGTLRVWDLETGRCVKTLENHSEVVFSVALAADGRWLVSGDKDAEVRVWDLETGRCTRTLEGHSVNVKSVAVTPDGRRAVSAGDDKTLDVWDLESGRSLWILEGDPGWIYSAAITADGRLVVSGGGDMTIRVWDLQTGLCLKTMKKEHTRGITSVAFTADGRRVVSGSHDKTVRVWDLETGRCLRTLEGESGSITSVALTADGRRVVSGSDDWLVRVWDLETGRCQKTFEGHTNAVRSVTVLADGQRALSGGWDRTLRLWDLQARSADPPAPEGHAGSVESVATSADGRHMVSAGEDKMVRVWAVSTEKCLGTLEGHAGSVKSVALTADQRCAVSGSADKTLRIWELETGRCLKTLEGHRERGWRLRTGESPEVNLSALPAEQRQALAKIMDATLSAWDLQTGQSRQVFEGPKGSVTSVTLTADGRRAVSGGQDTTVRIWDLENGRCLETLEGHTDAINSVALMPDGRRVLSASADGTLRVWDLATGHCLRRLEGHTSSVNHCVALATSEPSAVSGGQDGSLRVWNVETGGCLKTLEGDMGSVTSLAATPDGRCAIVGSLDKTLRLWDLQTGHCLAILAIDGLTSASLGCGVIVIGTAHGSLEVFYPTSPLLTGRPLVTAARVWYFGDQGSPGRWDDQLSVVCAWCGHRFGCEPPRIAAPGVPKFLSTDIRCPAPDCGQPLRLNPFVCDLRGRGRDSRS